MMEICIDSDPFVHLYNYELFPAIYANNMVVVATECRTKMAS